MHQFETPPSMVLDLGCGTGVWALDAAQQWPVSTAPLANHLFPQVSFQSSIIVGFDLVKRQPNLAGFEKFGMCKDLAKRLHWKQGNLCVQGVFSLPSCLSLHNSVSKIFHSPRTTLILSEYHAWG